VPATGKYLRNEFVRIFMDTRSPSAALESVFKRSHNLGEEFITYFYAVLDLCRKVSENISDEQNVFYVLRAMDPNIAAQLKLQDCSTPPNVSVGREIVSRWRL